MSRVAVKAKVLIVEDEVIAAMALADIVWQWGYLPCEPAVSGGEAISKAGSEAPDLVLMDVGLSDGMDGIEAARRIYTSFNIPIIFTSGYDEERIIDSLGLSGPFDFVAKPVDLDDLRCKMEKLLGKKRRGW
ncbi:MAG: response regulator [Actinomycetota bacterium]|nr:response regulator [Actinomycetota bacterium]